MTTSAVSAPGLLALLLSCLVLFALRAHSASLAVDPCVPPACPDGTEELDQVEPTDGPRGQPGSDPSGGCDELLFTTCVLNVTTGARRWRTCCNKNRRYDVSCLGSGGECVLLASTAEDSNGQPLPPPLPSPLPDGVEDYTMRRRLALEQVCPQGRVEAGVSCGDEAATCCASRVLCEPEPCPRGYELERLPAHDGTAPLCEATALPPLYTACHDLAYDLHVERHCCPLPGWAQAPPPPGPPPGIDRDSACAKVGGQGACTVDPLACPYGHLEPSARLCDGVPEVTEVCCAAISFCDFEPCAEGHTATMPAACNMTDRAEKEALTSRCTVHDHPLVRTCCPDALLVSPAGAAWRAPLPSSSSSLSPSGTPGSTPTGTTRGQDATPEGDGGGSGGDATTGWIVLALAIVLTLVVVTAVIVLLLRKRLARLIGCIGAGGRSRAGPDYELSEAQEMARPGQSLIDADDDSGSNSGTFEPDSL